jgi:hypothetical protein
MDCQFVSKLKVHKKMVEKHHLSSTLPKTITMEISIKLKYLDNRCFKITLEDKLITFLSHDCMANKDLQLIYYLHT